MGDSYAAVLGDKSASEGAEILRVRWANGKHTSERIANWIHEWSKLQNRHSVELERFLGNNLIGEEELGTLAEPWQRVVSMVLEQSRLAGEAAKRAQFESETPIREVLLNAKANELIGKVAKGNSEGVHRFQTLDMERLDGIKTSLTRFTTIETDRAQGLTTAGERATKAWLAYDTKDDIQGYVAQIVSGVTTQGSLRNGDNMTGREASEASSRQSSQSTVRRKSSFLGSIRDGSSTSGLRSKFGTIFGLKKNKGSKGSKNKRLSNDANGSNDALDTASLNSYSLNRQPDFGSGEHQRSNKLSKSPSPSSLRHPRARQTRDEIPVRDLRVSNDDDDSLYGASNPTHADAAYQTPTKGQVSSLPRSQSPLKSVTPQKQLTHDVDKQSASNISGDVPNSSFGGISQVGAQSNGVRESSSQHAPLNFETRSSSNTGAVCVVPPGSANSATSSSANAPTPPPARHSMHRVPSLTRSPSNASAARAQRDARVGSQMFANLSPAHDTLRDPSEGRDAVGVLPVVPSTPQTSAAGATEQFWTPAQRFPQQFQPFEHPNSSALSIGLPKQSQLTFPNLPGFVASAIEYIEAEYNGDQLAHSGVKGEAMARINGTVEGDATVLGILLADPQAKLSPSSLLHQTSSLSFDVPNSVYSTPQELVMYSAESAVGRVPIKLTPMWRFEASIVRLVLSFQLSDLFVGGSEVEIQDMIITVSIAGEARANSAQSKPVATFSREKQRVTWRFTQSQILKRGGPPTKLLCQFVTDGAQAQPGTIELKARLPSVENSVMQLRRLSPQGDWVAVPMNVGGEVVTRIREQY